MPLLKAAQTGGKKVFKVSENQLASWGGAALLKEADYIVKRGDVVNASFSGGIAKGVLKYGPHDLKTGFKLLSGGLIESHCPCAVNQREGRVCVHVVAVGLVLQRRANSAEAMARRADEERHAKAVEAASEAGDFIRRATAKQGGVPAEIRIRLSDGWVEQFWEKGRVEVECLAVIGGTAVPLNRLPANKGLTLQPGDDAILHVLEDICEGTAKGWMTVIRSDFVNLVAIHQRHGRKLYRHAAEPLTVHAEAVGAPMTVDLDRETGELLVFAAARLPESKEADPTAPIIAYGKHAWVCKHNDMWPLDAVLPGPYQMIYRQTVPISRTDVVRFIRQELGMLAKSVPVITEVSQDLFDFDPATPAFSVRVKGSGASIALTMHAVYDHIDVPACATLSTGDFALPNPDDLLRYRVRNLDAELLAVKRLNKMGFVGTNGAALQPIVGDALVMDFLGSRVPMMRRLGWKVSFEGSIAGIADTVKMAIPVVHIAQSVAARGLAGMETTDWFDVGVSVQTPEGTTISPADVERALRFGESYVERNGERYIFDAESITLLRRMFRDCANQENANGALRGTFRLDAIYAPYVQASLQALDGVDVEEPEEWREKADASNRQHRIMPVKLGDPLDSTLRPYQKDGVAWLRFLENNKVCGILADEMGLGKTLQALAWLQMDRSHESARDKPALIVCPTSLVENWEHEAKRFTPDLSVLVMSGAERHENWEKLGGHDVIVTSYALLRRDIDYYARHTFSVAILDEAQHIKNRATQNAQAAKQLRAAHRLVLTGTPVENSVADLWSIMNFLMPAYLGDYKAFRENFEEPMSHPEEPEAEDAHLRLRRKLHPFLMRRKKQEVAQDLPEKLIKVSYCTLTPDQRAVYNALLEKARAQIGGMVKEQGFERSRIEILAILMKLRQTCCHLALLKDKDLLAKATAPSAKMDQFFELLDEAIDGGHRMLVFSQFVSMLTLLREELDRRGIRYSYLDGSTKDRLTLVSQFNHDAAIPVFLISLKAGGTGLNLTGADMVVHFDPWWNPAVEDQATDRAHRIGQTRPVTVYRLITQNTIEEKIVRLHHEKRDIADKLLEGTDQAAKLSAEELIEILRG
ncbi:MAG: DEAD/DEAH box helicase [Kiritimatiellaeota bacterium]|nr:DEAD/DEAH box helicase [Kiritimatiellota bacterium]